MEAEGARDLSHEEAVEGSFEQETEEGRPASSIPGEGRVSGYQQDAEYEDELNLSGATTIDSEYEEYEDVTGLQQGVVVGEIKDEIMTIGEEEQSFDVIDGTDSEIVTTGVEGETVLVAVEYGEGVEGEQVVEDDMATDDEVITEGGELLNFGGEENVEYFDANDDEGNQIQLVEELVVGGEEEAMDQDLNNIASNAEFVNEVDVVESSALVDKKKLECSHKRKAKTLASDNKYFVMGVIDETDLSTGRIGHRNAGPMDIDVEDIENNSNEPVLEISTRRRLSQEGREGNCYCGKDRNFNIAEMLCASCYRWYHESCIGYQLGKLVPFMMNYVFVCKNCSPNGLESFKRNQAQFSQMCVTALANLTQMDMKEGKNRTMFSCERDIIPFFEMHWDAMTTTTRRVTQSWHSTVAKALYKDLGKHFVIEEKPTDPNSPFFGLKSLDITQIRPHYEAMIKTGHLKLAESQNSSAAKRGTKRRVGGGEMLAVSQVSVAKRTKGDTFIPKLASGHGYPSDHPFNKDGFRYVLAEPDSNAPYRQEFDESNDYTKIIPGFLYRVLNPWNVFLALHDRAPQLKVSEDRYSVTGEKGYSMIRATHGVSYGAWYWEAKIIDMPDGSATRIGWGQQYSNLQGPLGVDQFGYSYRSRFGTKFFEARGKHYGDPYGMGDVIGCLIILPEAAAHGRYAKRNFLPPSHKEKPLVRFKSHLYYEEKDENNEADLNSTHKGSKIIFFKNGVYQGVAFEDISDGIYYPAVSLYKNITVSVNFGPTFEYFSDEYQYKSMNERAEESTIQQTMSDLVFLTENEGTLRLDNY